MRCYICNEEKQDFRCLSKHIRDMHKNYNIKLYYDTFLKKDEEGVCLGCGCETNFQNINLGYHKMCSSKKCSGVFSRKKLKADPIKYEKFTKKVSNNMKSMWTNLSLEEKIKRVKNTNIKHQEWILSLSKEEKKLKFGWLNKLNEKEKNKKVEEIMQISLIKWWNAASEEQKDKTRKKILQTKIERGICIQPSEAKDFYNYSLKVRSLTEKNYRKYKSFINPNNFKRCKTLQLDHKVSVFSGYVLDIPIDIIASPFNLELIDGFKNNSKHTQNSMKIEELCELHSKMESSLQLTNKNT